MLTIFSLFVFFHVRLSKSDGGQVRLIYVGSFTLVLDTGGLMEIYRNETLAGIGL